MGDSNPRYLAELNGSRVYCDDIATAKAHLDYWKTAIALLGHAVTRRYADVVPCLGCSEALR